MKHERRNRAEQVPDNEQRVARPYRCSLNRQPLEVSGGRRQTAEARPEDPHRRGEPDTGVKMALRLQAFSNRSAAIAQEPRGLPKHPRQTAAMNTAGANILNSAIRREKRSSSCRSIWICDVSLWWSNKPTASLDQARRNKTAL